MSTETTYFKKLEWFDPKLSAAKVHCRKFCFLEKYVANEPVKALNDTDLLVPQKSASLGVLPSATGRPVVTSPTRSIRHGLVSPWIYRTTYVIQINPPQSSPHVPPLNYKTSSISMPASLASGRSSTSSRTRQNDRLVRLVVSPISKLKTDLFSSLVRKYAERRKEVKQARQKWLQWEEEKAEIQRRKVKTQKAIQVIYHAKCRIAWKLN